MAPAEVLGQHQRVGRGAGHRDGVAQPHAAVGAEEAGPGAASEEAGPVRVRLKVTVAKDLLLDWFVGVAFQGTCGTWSCRPLCFLYF